MAPGRRPRGPELPRFVAELREQAHSRREADPRVEPEEVRETS